MLIDVSDKKNQVLSIEQDLFYKTTGEEFPESVKINKDSVFSVSFSRKFASYKCEEIRHSVEPLPVFNNPPQIFLKTYFLVEKECKLQKIRLKYVASINMSILIVMICFANFTLFYLHNQIILTA